MGGQKQEYLGNVIELLKKLGNMPASKDAGKDGYRKPESLFEEVSGYSWHWSGESWVRSLEEILAKYKAESVRVKEALKKKRGY